MQLMMLMLVKCRVTAVRGETCRSFSLPENKLVANSHTQQLQPTTSASPSLTSSVDDKRPRTSGDPGTVDRRSTSADVSSTACDVFVTSHDAQSPIRNVRPTRLDMASIHSSKADLSPDDRKPLVGILLNRSPRRNSLIRCVNTFVRCVIRCVKSRQVCKQSRQVCKVSSGVYSCS